MQPVSTTNSSGVYTVDLIDQDEDVKPARAYSSNDEAESDSESFNIDGSQKSIISGVRRNDQSEPSSSSDDESESGSKSPKNNGNPPASDKVFDTTEEFYSSVENRFSLITDENLDRITDPDILRKICKLQKNVVVMAVSETKSIRKQNEEIKAEVQISQARNSAALASRGIALNQQTRTDIAEIKQNNWKDNIQRIGSIAISILTFIITVVCIVL